MNKCLLAPSILSANFANLTASINQIEPLVVKAIRPLSKRIFDVHLMVDNPDRILPAFVDAGADYITFHWENVIHHHRVIQQIHSLGKKAGICIVPSTPVSAITEILPYVDLILVMTVNPGFGGQKLIPSCIQKLSDLIAIRNKNNYNYLVSVDGGINNDTLTPVLKTGVDVVVSGSSFFSGSLKWEK